MADVSGSNLSSDAELDAMMKGLVAELRPVKPLAAPGMRALAWLSFFALLAIALGAFADIPAIADRLCGATDMWLAVAGSTLTAVLGTFAAFQLAVPDRSRAWALLPLPALALWIGASGMGCARSWLLPGTHDASLAESGHCLTFILGLSIPMSALMFLMLRRGYSLSPGLTAGTAGLAVAAAAATLLTFFHPFDAALSDLLVHAFAVGLVVLVNRLFVGRVLRRSETLPVARATN